jgi:hypothetical protein
LHHPTGRASAVCRTFEMTYIDSVHIKLWNIISKFWLISTFVNVYLHTIFPIWYVDTLQSSLYHISHACFPRLNRHCHEIEGKDNFIAARLLFYIFTKTLPY